MIELEGKTPAQQVDEITRFALETLHRVHLDGADEPIEIDDIGIMHGAGVTYVPLSDKMQPLATLDGDVDGIVWHWTDTRNAGAANLARRIAKPGGPSRSCHLWIDAGGAIAQSATFRRGTWHAGSDTAALFKREMSGLWRPLEANERGKVRGVGANSWAAGIELENVGEVRLNGDQWLGWPFRHDFHDRDGTLVKPAIVPVTEVVQRDATHGHHAFAVEQLRAAKRATSALVRRYGLLRANCAWGHCNVDPTRRTDPGPLWLGPKLDAKAGHLRELLDAVYAA